MKTELTSRAPETNGPVRSPIRRLALEGVSLLALTLAAGMAMTAPTLAQTAWTGAVSDDWFQGGNWSAGVPGSSSSATVNDLSRPPVIAGGGQAEAGFLVVGEFDPGALTIEDGALSAYHVTIGMDGGDGTVVVTGPNAALTADTAITLGLTGSGTLDIRDGADVSSLQGVIGAGVDSFGTVILDGSRWTSTGGGMIIGQSGEGHFTVSGGGLLVATSTILAANAGSTGVLRLEGGAGGSGVLETGQLSRGDGTSASVVFDGGTLRLTTNQGNLLSGFATGDVTLAAGGGTIDTGDNEVDMVVGLAGTGGLTKTGRGTLNLWGPNTYSGTTLVEQGTLRAREANVLSATSTHEISTGTTLQLDNNQTIGGLAGSGSVVLGNSTLTTGTDHASTTFGGVVSGSGALVKVGTETLTLSGSNTYAGGTTINAGILQLGDADNQGRIVGDVTVGGGAYLNIVNANTDGIANITNGSGGTVTWSGASTAGSAVITNNYILGFGNTSTAGSAEITNNEWLQFFHASTAGEADIVNNANAAVTFYGTSTAGEADIVNNHMVSFTNTSTAGGATIANAMGGNLYFVNTSTAGNADITNDGSLYFVDTSTAGDAAITNNGSLYFNDASTAGGATIINDRFWYLNDTSTAGSADITNNFLLNFYDASTAGSATITNDGGLNFYTTSTAGSADIINDVNAGVAFFDTSTAGDAAITNDGSLSFYNTSTADTAKITNDGNLYFRDTSTAGSATIITEADGRTYFSESTSGGDARLIANGGAFDFSNLASSGTTAGSIEGAGDFRLGSKTLTVGSNNRSTTVTGAIADGGSNGGVGASLVKVGTGTLTLAGTNTYTGPTTILGGLLNVTGSLASALEVSSGGRIGGTGTLAIVIIGNGGILAPGNSIGTVTVGTLTLGSGSIYEVELIAGGNMPGVHNDLTNVTGTATINAGATIHVLPENGADAGITYTPNTVYTVIQTAAPGDLIVNGVPAITDAFAFLNFAGSHDGQNFYLTSSLAATTFCLRRASTNQCGVGDAAFALAPGNPVFDAILGLGENEVADALNSLSGEAHASVQTVIESTFAQLGQTLTRRGSDGLAALKAAMEPLNYAAGAQGPGLAAIDSAMFSPVAAAAWLTPVGGRGHVAADANAAALNWWHGGLAGGYEVTSNNALGGLAFGYHRGSASIAARQSQSTLDSFMLGTYVALRDGPNAISGALTLGASLISTSRTVNVGGTISQANADYWTQSLGLSLEAAHDIELGNGTTISPLVTLGLGWSGHGGFVETGAGAFNLTAAPKAAIALDAGLGLGFSHVVDTEVGTLTLSGRALWEHSFTGVNTQSMTFAGGATSFTVNGPAAGTDRLRIGAGLTFEAGDSLTMGLVYDGTFSAAQQAHKASTSFNLKF